MLKEKLAKDEWTDFSSGRIEHRCAYVCEQLELLDDLASWPAIKRILMVEVSSEKDGKVENKIRFYLRSLMADASTFNRLLRNHWSIENNLHWMPDSSLGRPKPYPEG